MNISIVIPSYNSEKYIRPCLDAIMHQTTAPYEIIVVDSSTDDTPQIILKEFPKVQLHHMEKQTMPGAARNIGLNMATGDIVLFLDTDAIPDTDWVEQHEKLHAENPNTIMFGGAILNQNPEHLFSRLAYISEFTGYSDKDDPGERSVVPSVNMSVKRRKLHIAGVKMPETSLPGGEEVFMCNELIRKGYTIQFDAKPVVRHINRTTWNAYIGHMRSSGFAGGVVARDHKVAYRGLSKIGPLAVLAAPMRLLLVWKRLFKTDRSAFIESLFFSPILLWGFTEHMWQYYKGSRNTTENDKTAHIATAGLITVILAAITISIGLSITRTVTSDPACYLNYAKQISHGKLFFDSIPAEIVYHFGGEFKESAFHGYMFPNQNGKLYSFVNIGFPFILAIFIKIFGLAAGTIFNVFLLPAFLLVYMLTIRSSLKTSSSHHNWGLPLLAVSVLFYSFIDPLSSWAQPYREISSVLVALAAILLAMKDWKTDVCRKYSPVLFGLLLGISTIIRETSALMAVPAVMLACRKISPDLKWKQTIIKCTFIAMLTAGGMAVGYSPQLVVNKIQRNTFLGKQIEAATTHITEVKANDTADESSAGLNLKNLTNKLPQRLGLLRGKAGYALLFLFTGIAISFYRDSINFGIVTAIPAALYILLYSAFDQEPGLGRYEMMIYLFLVPLTLFGLTKTLEVVADLFKINSSKQSVNILCIILAICLCAIQSSTMLRTDLSHKTRVSDLAGFEKELTPCITEMTIILSEIPARDYLQYLMPANAVSIYNFIERGISVRALTQYCNDNSISLLFFKSINRATDSTPYDTNELENMLRDEASLELLHTFPASKYRLTKVLGEKDPELYRVTPLSSRKKTVNLKNTYEGENRISVDAGILADGDRLKVSLNEKDLKDELPGNRAFVTHVPPSILSDDNLLTIESDLPHSDNVRVYVASEKSAFSIRLGSDATDLPYLREGWFDDRRPSANNFCRRLPPFSAPIDLSSLKQILPGDNLTVYAGIHPISDNLIAKTSIQWSHDETNWQKTAYCYNKDGLLVGFLIRNIDPTQKLYLRNQTEYSVYTYLLAIGKEHADLSVSVSGNSQGALWNILTIDDKSGTLSCTTEAEMISRQIKPLDLPSAAGKSYILLNEVPYAGNSLVTFTLEDMRLEPIFKSGFYNSEKDGRWMYPNAELYVPASIVKSGGEVILKVRDNKPVTANPTEISIKYNGKQIFNYTITDHSEAHSLKALIPTSNAAENIQKPYLEISATGWSPSELIPGCGDKRRLGLFIESITTK